MMVIACGSKEQPCDGASGTLPPVGSACEPEGQACYPNDDPCPQVAHVECEGGKWVEVQPPGECFDGETSGTTTTGTPTTSGTTAAGSTGGAGCDPNDLPEVGSACAMEGEFCSPGCEDPCQFCNVLRCEGGVWTQLEAPPAPCAGCEEICSATLAGMCPAGPPDQAACVSGCMDIMGGPCALAYSEVRACAGQGATITCDTMGRPTVIGCEKQFTALYECLGI